MCGLGLGSNPIGERGLQTIILFDAVKQNKTLYLNVAFCGMIMTDTGMASLADALHTNSTLKTLHIIGNEAITENGLTYLVEAVSRHSGLVRQYLPSYLMDII